jgi:HSP20 family molecular chaperone IbpA
MVSARTCIWGLLAHHSTPVPGWSGQGSDPLSKRRRSPTGGAMSGSSERDPDPRRLNPGEDREKAQEVRTVEESSPQSAGRAGQPAHRPVFVPPADIYANRDSLVVLCEMPGVGSDRVDITRGAPRVLPIRARSREQEHSSNQRADTEYTDGDYERVFHVVRGPRPRPHRGDRGGQRLASGAAKGRTRQTAPDRAEVSLAGRGGASAYGAGVSWPRISPPLFFAVWMLT